MVNNKTHLVTKGSLFMVITISASSGGDFMDRPTYILPLLLDYVESLTTKARPTARAYWPSNHWYASSIKISRDLLTAHQAAYHNSSQPKVLNSFLTGGQRNIVRYIHSASEINVSSSSRIPTSSRTCLFPRA